MVKAIKTYISNILNGSLKIAKYVFKSLRFITPYFLLLTKDYLPLWLLLVIPVIVWVITSVANIYLNQKNLGDRIPVPEQRFTEDLGDGEIVVKNDRIQELILYTYDVEEWLKEKGYTR